MPKRALNSISRENSSKRVIPKLKRHVAPDIDPAVRTYYKEPGVVMAFGQGDIGQLGLGPDIMERLRPTVVSSIESKIVNICAGGMHTLCLTDNGEVLSFGCNDEGALGRDGEEFEPTIISSLPAKVLQLSAGNSHSAAILEDGRLFAWGSFRDNHGSMGLTINGQQNIPIQIPIDDRVIKIASGNDHLVILTASGQVYTCGCGEQGQLGRISERSASRSSRRGLNPLLTPTPVVLQRRLNIVIDDIWASGYCTFIKDKSQGHIYVFGLNNFNQLGLLNPKCYYHPTISESFSSITWALITGGEHHTIALDSKGVTYACGRKEYGRLGMGEDCNDLDKPTPIPALRDEKCVDVSSSSCVSFAVSSNGDVFSWGMGTNGQLGTGNEDDVHVPEKIVCKQLEGRSVVQVAGGGQHTVLLAVTP